MPRQSYYDEVEIEDFKWDPEKKVFHYPCPCGDRFEITKGQLRDGDDVATCPSCSLLLRVVYEWDDYADYDSDEEAVPDEEVLATPPHRPIATETDVQIAEADAAPAAEGDSNKADEQDGGGQRRSRADSPMRSSESNNAGPSGTSGDPDVQTVESALHRVQLNDKDAS